MTLSELLEENKLRFAPILGTPLAQKNVVRLDLSAKNEALQAVGLSDYIQQTLGKSQIGIGGYAEPRAIYQTSAHFSQNNRSIHLGIDIWVAAQTVVCAPFKGKVHSFANNQAEKDYGPTLILEHQLVDSTEKRHTFYTLYGHLTTDSIRYIQLGQTIKTGEPFCHIGFEHENGGWQPHLHFQVIGDMQGKKGDFQGVANPSEAQSLLDNGANPMLMLC